MKGSANIWTVYYKEKEAVYPLCVAMLVFSRQRKAFFFKLGILEIEIPKGCKKITIEVEDGKMIVTCSSIINSSEFLCDETAEMEELPKVGDFAIFWSNGCRKKAACMNLKRMEGITYIATDDLPYSRAIKFRNYEQYLKVRGVYGEDEP